jgi:hypothetical protein
MWLVNSNLERRNISHLYIYQLAAFSTSVKYYIFSTTNKYEVIKNIGINEKSKLNCYKNLNNLLAIIYEYYSNPE